MSHADFDFEDDDDLSSSRPSLDDVLAALQSGEDRLPGTQLLYGLSDLTEADIERLQPVYAALDTGFRRLLAQMLADISDNNYQIDYEAVGLLLLSDPDADVRQTALEILAEYDSTYVLNRLMRAARQDRSLAVRAEATRTLGRFVLAGELGDISATNFQRVQQCVLELLNNAAEPLEVRRRALEALANCSHEQVIPAITAAYDSGDDRLKVSAVTAMGNSSDERWESIILRELESGSPVMRQEAARAAGEIQSQEATGLLIRLLNDSGREGREAAITALGELGNREALRALNLALDVATEEDDEALIDLIENALGNASLVSGKLMLMEVEPDE
ncbi:MAG: HEAT repeat domain-containing protein [Anaerolineae bacterium]|jgi:HEAT repeat protein|nr:HEAT repeat domain-containing protein [Anaerolineae bacterium]